MKKVLYWFVGDNRLLWKIHEGKPWKSRFLIFKIFESIMRGFGQVCFANNSFSGLIIFIALIVADPLVGLAALLASFSSLIMSKMLGQPDSLVVSGLQNYSAVLVGTVTASLFPVFYEGSMTTLVWIEIAVMGAFSVCVALGLGVFLSTNNLPVYTLPFNLVTSLLFMSFTGSGFSYQVQNTTISIDAVEKLDWVQITDGVVKCSGQVYAIENTLSSLLILVALLLNSPFLTMCSIVGGLLSSLIAISVTTAPYSAIYAGIWGYNGFLAAGCIAFFTTPSLISFFIAALNAVFTALIQVGLTPLFRNIHLPIFTFPFCLSSLLFLALAETVPALERVKELSFPEEHFWKEKEGRKREKVTLSMSENLTN